MQQATCVTYMSRTLTLAASDLRAVLHVTFSHAYYSSYEHTIKRAECEPRIFDPAGELRVSHRCFGLSRQTHHRPIEWFDAELLPHEARMIQTANSINWHPENESVLMVLTSHCLASCVNRCKTSSKDASSPSPTNLHQTALDSIEIGQRVTYLSYAQHMREHVCLCK